MRQNHSQSDNNHNGRSRSSGAQGAHLGSEILATADALRNQIGDLRAKNVKTGLRLQTEMFDALQAVGREWMTRATSEAELALNLSNRLTKARTVPDAISAYQGWLTDWLALCGEDGRSLFSDGQRIVDTSARCLASVTRSGELTRP